MNTWSVIGQITTAISPVCLVVWFIWEKYNSGSSKIQEQVSNGYKQRTEQLEEQVTRLIASSEEHSREIARLNGVLQEKDKQIDNLTQLIKDKNPETIKLLTEVRDSLSKFATSMLQKQDYQTKMLEDQKV